MRRFISLTVFALILAACKPSAVVLPTPTIPAPSPTVTLAATPTSTPTLAPAASPTPSPLPAGMQKFIFPHYESLMVLYPSLDWQADKGMGQGLLASKTVAGCEINDTYADAPPEPQYSTRMGNLDYQTTRQQTAAGLAVNWFFPPDELVSPDPDATEPVVLIVTSPAGSESKCLQAAHPVLASLSASGIP
jgi:hypothetical protein